MSISSNTSLDGQAEDILLLDRVDRLRTDISPEFEPTRRAELGQFMTPVGIARFMASLFTQSRYSPVRLLDAGAGIGSLSAAFIEEWKKRQRRPEIMVEAYEVDATLGGHLRKHLKSCGNEANVKSNILDRDFIEAAVNNLQYATGQRFTHAILNPPYKKINSNSSHRMLLRAVGIETVNLYSAFVALAIELLEDGGEIVAIIPRSFCNGLYYFPFRKYLLRTTTIKRIHLFESRTSAFNDDEVLQENIIIHLVRGATQEKVVVSVSSDASFADLRCNEFAFEQIVNPEDLQRYIHIPSSGEHLVATDLPLATHSLEELGIGVSTGPVVDFRLRASLRAETDETTVPLLYPNHFTDGKLEWPKVGSKKPNAIVLDQDTRKWLYAAGHYAIVKRFSSKEEARRVVAYVVDPAKLSGDMIGFENHWNVFHQKRHGLTADIARGLAIFLNSGAVDQYFRQFSGHTQVNATDLRLLKYPDKKVLCVIGRWAQDQSMLSEAVIDKFLKNYEKKQQQKNH